MGALLSSIPGGQANLAPAPACVVGAGRRVRQPATAIRLHRVYVRRRVMVVVALFALVTGTAGVARVQRPVSSHPLPIGQVPAGASRGLASAYLVQPGDTLWGIARSLRPHGDVRPLVARLAQAHGTVDLQVGDQIRLPERE